LQRQFEETLISLEAAPGIFAAQAVASLRHAMQQAFARLATLLSERENQGQVRRCHGDLHLRNIVLIEDRPVLFDGIASLKPRHAIPACVTIGGPAASIPVEDLTSENDG
jgi:aminoglycoside phosphotransferase family enzyme